MNLNKFFLSRMRAILGNEYNDFIESLHVQKQGSIRVNTLKIDKGSLKKLLPFETSDVKWCGDGLLFDSSIRIAKNHYYSAGLYYIQEASAMLTGSLLNIEENDKVLDLCSAPGGKSTHIACKLENSGFLVCNDISATRLKAVIKNIELMGIKNASIICEPPEKLAKKFPGYFNKIIVDAPCSGEGMFSINSDVLKSWKPEDEDSYPEIQLNLLNQAAELLAYEGEIIYSTCTFSIKENESVIKRFLDTHEDFTILPIDHEKYSVSKGLAELVSDERLSSAARIWPHKSDGHGHFAAVLKKIDRINETKKVDKPALENNDVHFNKKNLIFPISKESMVFPASKKKNPNAQDNKPYLESFNIFAEKYFVDYKAENLLLVNGKLFSVAKGMPDFKGIRVLKSGFYLGDIKNKRFEPSQALAMGLKYNEFKNKINLTDEYIKRYLAGESFPIDDSVTDGYTLVCIDNYPIGFGKVINGRMKNKYSRTWMIQ